MCSAYPAVMTGSSIRVVVIEQKYLEGLMQAIFSEVISRVVHFEQMAQIRRYPVLYGNK